MTDAGFTGLEVVPPAPKAIPGYRSDIDGLRSIAVLLVVIFHFDLADALAGGFIGVDMFFVISGFLIVPAIRSRIEDRSFRFREFYAKRIRRLAPPLVATTMLTLSAAIILLTPIELQAFAKEAIAAQLYFSNFYYWRFLNYFGLQAGESFLLHTWSLGIEEQFYLAFPLLLWVTGKLVPRRMTAVLVIILVGSFVLNLAAVSWKPEATFYLLPTRAWEFAAGALVPQVAALFARWRVPRAWLAAVGLALLGGALFVYEPTIAFPGTFAALPVAATMALLIAGTDADGWWARIMSRPLPVGIGRISYELYLIHWPVRVFAPILILDYSFGMRLATLALCFILAVAIYRLVEVPVRSRRILSLDRKLVVTYAAATGAILAVCTVALQTVGLPGRLTRQQLAMAANAGDDDATFRHCENRFDAPCVIGDARKRPSWIVYGDSHADALASAFSDVLRARGAAGWFVFQSGCLPILNSGHHDCRDFNRKVGQLIAAHPGIRDVVAVSTWRQPLERGYTDEAGKVVEAEAALDAFRRNLDRTIVERTSGDRRLTIWFPVPGARRSVPATLARNSMLGRNWDISYSTVENNDRFAFLTHNLARYPNLHIIRADQRICRGGVCRIMFAGRPLYHDDAHPAGSQRLFFRAIIAQNLPPPRP